MKRHQSWIQQLWCIGSLLVLVACSASQPSITATPTPIAEDPSFAEVTYTVARGNVERIVEETARVVPVESITYSFAIEGTIATVDVQTGDRVTAGQLLATVKQDEAKEKLRAAADSLDEAKANYATAQKLNQQQITAKRKAVDNAREALNDLLPGGDKDALLAAQTALDEAQRAVRTTTEDSDATVDNAEYAITTATNTLVDTQFAYSTAYWHLDWVNRYGTDPITPFKLDGTPNLLDEAGKRNYIRAFNSAKDNLRTAEKAVQSALRDAQRAKEKRQTDVDKASKTYQTAQKERDKLLAGQDNSDIRTARVALESAEADLAVVMNNTLSSEKKSVDIAQRAFDKAQKDVTAGQIVATADGIVSVVSVAPGQTTTAYAPIIEVAKPDNVEFSSNLTDDTMQLLREGQNVEIRPVDRPELVLDAVIRKLPAPYGKNGGNISDPDKSTRFNVIDTQGFALVSGDIGTVRIIIEQRSNALWLPPEAIRSFGDRTFVVLREGDQERRVTVKLGISGDDRVEILDGLKLNDVVVGQ